MCIARVFRTAGRLPAIIGAMVITLGVPSAASAAPPDRATRNSDSRLQIAPNRILVRFKDKTAATLRSTVNDKLKARVLTEARSVRGLQVVQVASPSALAATLDAYRRDPNVLYAEPDYRLTFDETVPNDPLFSSLWGLRNTAQNGGQMGADINAVRAWDITTGRPNVYVGVVDSGVDYTHPDLAANMWVNSGEIAANGIDDDANGYVDDIHGINGVTGAGDPMDFYGHGTHVSGTIAAQGNNDMGVVGVNWSAKVIACSLLDAQTLEAFVSGAIVCLDYLYELKTKQGIDIVATNNSWGWVGTPSIALQDAISRQNDAGILFVASAGNNATDTAKVAHYPANYPLPNVISVAASDRTDHKASFSNFGKTTVHIAAPGVDIQSTTPGNNYETHSGTSMASPHVVGVLALLKAQDPTRDWIKLKNLLLTGGQSVESMRPFTITGRRLLAAGDGGNGSLTCADQHVTQRLSPHANAVTLDYGSAATLDLSVLSISCDHADSAPVIVVTESGQQVTTLDDGAHADGAAADGIFAGQLAISAQQQEPLTLEFPNGDNVKLSFALNYDAPTTTSGQWRDLSTDGQAIALGDDSTYVLQLPFGLHIGDGDETLRFLAIADNGYVVPTVDEASAYNVFSAFLNLPLPQPWFNSMIAPFWDDLFPGIAGRVYWAVRGSAPARELVIEWRNFEHFFNPGSVTFQVVLFEGVSTVLFNYADVTFGAPELDRGASATVGIQSSANISRQFSTDDPRLNDGMSVEWRVRNFAPRIATLTHRHVIEGQAVEFDVTASDINHTTPVISHGGIPAASTFDAKTARFSWRRPIAGDYSVQFIATDAVDPTLTTTQTVSIRVDKNHVPVIAAISPQRVAEGTPVRFTALVSDENATPVFLGAVGIPDGALFDPETGVFEWSNPKVGTYNVSIIAVDSIDPRLVALQNVAIDAYDPRVVATSEEPDVGQTGGKKASWLRRTFLGGIDLPWLLILGLVAIGTRRRRLLGG